MDELVLAVADPSLASPNSRADASELVSYLQASEERTRGNLSRELHDDMGGLLVSAVMDAAFAEQALPTDSPLRRRLLRVRSSLAAAIDLNRRILEDLTPSILSMCGLLAALKWEVKRQCQAAQSRYSERYPQVEPAFTPSASTALFRIVQESLQVVLHQPGVGTVQVALDIDADSLRIAVSHGDSSKLPLSREDSFAIGCIAHRVHALGGTMNFTDRGGDGAIYSTILSLDRLTLPLLTDAA